MRTASRIGTAFTLAFLYFPLAVIALYAFNEGRTPKWPLPGLSLEWFGRAIDNEGMRDALWASVKAATFATLAALILGTLLAGALSRFKFFGRDVLTLLVILPIALPGIVTGMALNATFTQFLGVELSLFTIVAGHATFCIVVVYNNVVARLRRLSPNIEEAAADLGATQAQTFWHVTFPQLRSALVAGALLAFALSFDEVIVTTFTAGNDQTLPIWILANLSRPNQLPIVNVVALFVIVLSLIPVYLAHRLTDHARTRARPGFGATIWLKREDLAHTGAHKINNTIGQALLTRRMGKQRVIAETGAGQHGVATATAAAHFGLTCEVYMGVEDVRRQNLNVTRMKMLGARVIEVDAGSKTLKDATNEAMRDWMASVEHTHYILGSVVGPHPFPMIVRDFQSVIGRETRTQVLQVPGSLPHAIVACVGGGSNAAGIFYPFVDDPQVALFGVEAGGHSPQPGRHAASLCHGSPGVLHGSLSYVLQDQFGQTAPVHSCSAGLDYPGVGPEHSYWKDTGRVAYSAVTDQHLVINLSGRGDKDVAEASRLLGSH